MARIMNLLAFCFISLLAYDHVACIPQFTRLMTETYQKEDLHIYQLDNLTLTCGCKKNIETIYLDREILDEILTACDRPLVMMKKCKDCIILDDKCIQLDLDEKGTEKKRLFNCTRSFFKLEEGTILKDCDNPDFGNYRGKRDIVPNTCKSPIRMRNDDVTCSPTKGKIPDIFRTCYRECIEGYNLKNGQKWTYECKISANKWKPAKFPKCEPSINCTARMIPPGSIDCDISTSQKVAECVAECGKYLPHERISRPALTCKDTVDWNVNLDFCVMAGSNSSLVPLPPKSSE